ncbi:hypothetical protein FB451DRAFT_1379216 [Mycena latifolia]|nr:hypothetical protein FB451DRAFT_1379216 [Mycena latifolia]
MSSLSETSLSLLAPAPPPTSTAANILLAALVLTATAYIVHYASPMRLTRVLVTAIAETEKTYLVAIEAGVLPKSDADTAATLTSLQLKVSSIREATLRHSLSYRAALGAFLTGHTFTILHCIRDILKEACLRASDPASESAMRMVSSDESQKRENAEVEIQPWEFYAVSSAHLGKLGYSNLPGIGRMLPVYVSSTDVRLFLKDWETGAMFVRALCVVDLPNAKEQKSRSSKIYLPYDQAN